MPIRSNGIQLYPSDKGQIIIINFSGTTNIMKITLDYCYSMILKDNELFLIFHITQEQSLIKIQMILGIQSFMY